MNLERWREISRLFGPQLLPDGDTLLFGTVKRASPSLIQWDDARVVIHSLRTGQRAVVVERGTDAQYVSSGHIVHMVSGTLFAAPFDLSTRKLTGPAAPIVDGVALGVHIRFGHWANFAVSDTGSLVYIPGPRPSIHASRGMASESPSGPSPEKRRWCQPTIWPARPLRNG